MLKSLKKLFNRKHEKSKDCDHLFFPHYDGTIDRKYPIGQKCALCNHFNSNEDLGITFDLEELKKQHNAKW